MKDMKLRGQYEYFSDGSKHFAYYTTGAKPTLVGAKWIVEDQVFVWKLQTNGKDLYEGDKVIVKGTKRVGEYETEVVFKNFGFTLKENKTYITDSACIVCIRDIVENV